LQQLIETDPEAPPLEYLRLLRAEGLTLGESTFYRLYGAVQAQLPPAATQNPPLVATPNSSTWYQVIAA
jgi:hypothetical protein